MLQAALHEACRDLALRFCPHLSGGATRATARLVARHQITAGGRPLSQSTSDPYLLQQWELAEFTEPPPPHPG